MLQLIVVVFSSEPPYKDGVNEETAKPRTVTTSADPNKVFVNFTNVFSDKYGEVIQYTVIVTEDENSADIANKHILPGWKVAKQDRSIKAYQVHRH